MSVPADIKKLLTRFASSRGTRNTEFSNAAPCKWQPTATTDPRTKQPFTDDNAWEYIIEYIDNGTKIYKIILKKPAGKIGYTMLLPSIHSDRPIYIKLQICGDHVKGRSFHYCEQGIDPGEDAD